MKFESRLLLFGCLFLAGCGTPQPKSAVPASTGAGEKMVVIFTQENAGGESLMTFPLKREYGLVLRHYRSSVHSSPLTYELFSRKDGRILSTVNQAELSKGLEQLPVNAQVDFYDTCTVSLSSDSDKAILRYCDELGKAGAYYVMSAEFGSIGKPRAWKWKAAGR
jgi:hypothetical protein